MGYKVDWPEGGLCVNFWGLFDFAENLKATTEVCENPRFKTIKYAILDLSDISDFGFTDTEVSETASVDKLVSTLNGSIKMAVLAKDKKTRELCDRYVALYHVNHAGWQFLVSDHMEEIQDWVGLS